MLKPLMAMDLPRSSMTPSDSMYFMNAWISLSSSVNQRSLSLEMSSCLGMPSASGFAAWYSSVMRFMSSVRCASFESLTRVSSGSTVRAPDSMPPFAAACISLSSMPSSCASSFCLTKRLSDAFAYMISLRLPFASTSMPASTSGLFLLCFDGDASMMRPPPTVIIGE